MQSYFFGPSDGQLLAVLHPRQGDPVPEHGVVLCYPWGHEYVNALRGCRQLATRLARSGFDVLRFDFAGCGDSAGAGEDVDLGHWLADIAAAIDELKARAQISTVSLVGVRLGASLAALAAARRTDVAGLVLWEPVVSGAAYLAELRARHAAFLRSEAEEGRRQDAFSTPDEIMGFPLPGSLSHGLERLDLLTLPHLPVKHVLLIADEHPGSQETLTAYLRGLCRDVVHLRLPGQKIWLREVGQERALVPVGILEAVMTWLSDRWPA